MKMLLLKKKKTVILSCTVSKTHLLHLLRSFSASLTIQNPNPKTHFMEGYLITSCGFPPEAASRAAKRLTTLQSPDRPDSIISFLKNHGFDNTHIRSLISSYPPLLCSNVEKSIESNMRSLIGMGFSGTDLPRVIIRNPMSLTHRNITPRIQFWRTLFGNDEKKLRMVFERNRCLISYDIAKCITPKITLLKNHGLSDQQIQSLLLLGNGLFTRSSASIEALLKWTLELGFQSHSSMFVWVLRALSLGGRAPFEAKMKLLKSYGWSDCEFRAAFHQAPVFTVLSEKSIRTKMEFLVGRAGCTPSYVALHPMLLGFSLEKRLIPRHHVLQILKAKEFAILDFNYIMNFTDKMFLEKFVARYKDEVPELCEIYLAACAGRFLDPYQNHLGLKSS